ncbi:MAG: acyl-ACP--UDP-N-acetylglucosamine O-acyltransferase [Rhodobacteraceae bacterium]|nr:acyl-ACP--UDP-N-acetylglucosamine O-acyltransferase [Paracoccaceae bacterium]
MASVIDPSASIHASAIVADGAVIGAGVRIGPYCVVGPDVILGSGVVLDSHVVVAGQTTIGEGTRIWPFASVGTEPQDLKFAGEKTRVEIGRNNRIREYATVNPGTDGGGGVTRVGDNNLLMMHTHLAHDCIVGNHVVLANAVQVAGHVTIGDNAVLGGSSGIHQFVRIGQGAMIGGGSIVVNDVIPYGSVVSPRGTLGGLNLIGLKRRGMDKDRLNELRHAYKALFSGEGALLERARALADAAPDNPLVQDVLDFVLANSDRSFCTPE